MEDDSNSMTAIFSRGGQLNKINHKSNHFKNLAIKNLVIKFRLVTSLKRKRYKVNNSSPEFNRLYEKHLLLC